MPTNGYFAPLSPYSLLHNKQTAHLGRNSIYAKTAPARFFHAEAVGVLFLLIEAMSALPYHDTILGRHIHGVALFYAKCVEERIQVAQSGVNAPATQ